MIVHGKTRLCNLLRPCLGAVFMVVMIVIGVEALNNYVDLQRPVFSMAALGLLTTALSIFLVFRMNEAYSRWWESRILWGGIVNASRSFARQATTLLSAPANGADCDGADQEEIADQEGIVGAQGPGAAGPWQRELVYRHLAYINALRMSLRRERDWQNLSEFLEPAELRTLRDDINKPAQLLQTQGRRLADARRHGLLDAFAHLMLDSTLTEICALQGGCERIKNTVLSDRVVYFTRLIAWCLAVLIPVCIIDWEWKFDYIEFLVVPVMMLVFILTELLGAELKNPFENRPNDTPMSALCRTIEIDLRQQLGETRLPDPIEPEDGILIVAGRPPWVQLAVNRRRRSSIRTSQQSVCANSELDVVFTLQPVVSGVTVR
jgi:ion channel-forming bestrophin family protein